jgi:hypothetical protein
MKGKHITNRVQAYTMNLIPRSPYRLPGTPYFTLSLEVVYLLTLTSEEGKETHFHH